MGKQEIHVIFDANIWISFAIGKRLSELKVAFAHSQVKIFVCRKLLREVGETLKKPKLLAYITPDRKNMLLEIMQACQYVNVSEQTNTVRDPKDNYLLDMASTINADYLITGDKDLLVIKNHQHTNIVSFVSFMAIIETL